MLISYGLAAPGLIGRNMPLASPASIAEPLMSGVNEGELLIAGLYTTMMTTHGPLNVPAVP